MWDSLLPRHHAGEALIGKRYRVVQLDRPLARCPGTRLVLPACVQFGDLEPFGTYSAPLRELGNSDYWQLRPRAQMPLAWPRLGSGETSCS